MNTLVLTPAEQELVLSLRNCPHATRSALHHLTRESVPDSHAGERHSRPLGTSDGIEVEYRFRCLMAASNDASRLKRSVRELATSYLQFLETGIFAAEGGE